MVIRKILLATVVVLFVVSIVAPLSFATCAKCGDGQVCASCQKKPAKSVTDKDPGDALRKLGRGASNCATFPLEIFNQISKTNNSDGPMAALSYGLAKGVIMTGYRAVVGVYEVLTFPIPFPQYYKPILVDPEFMLEDWTV
jgi:putative exosortase-associated protein (TIGR04073 family)